MNVNKVSCSLWRQQVVYWEDDTKPDTVGKVRISGNFTQVNVSGLRPSTAYYLSVAAFNTAGPGPQSPPINATTKEPRESTRSPRTPNPPPPCWWRFSVSAGRAFVWKRQQTASVRRISVRTRGGWAELEHGATTKPRLSPATPG